MQYISLDRYADLPVTVIRNMSSIIMQNRTRLAYGFANGTLFQNQTKTDKVVLHSKSYFYKSLNMVLVFISIYFCVNYYKISVYNFKQTNVSLIKTCWNLKCQFIFRLRQALLLVCLVEGGHPSPKVIWWRDGVVWDSESDPSTYEEVLQVRFKVSLLFRLS